MHERSRGRANQVGGLLFLVLMPEDTQALRVKGYYTQRIQFRA